jgi:hypothetical protein
MGSQLVWNLFAVLALAALAPANVTATKLDGTAVTGQLQAWSAEEIVLKTTDGPLTLPAADVLSLEFSSESTNDSGRPIMELVDGTILPLADVAVANNRVVARLEPPSPAEPQPIAIPLDKVRSIRLQPLAAEVLPQWQEIRALGVPSDLIVVVKRGGNSLDHLECVLGQITANEVEFKIDEKQVRVPRNKVAGVIYYRSDDSNDRAPRCILLGREGLVIHSSAIDWAGESLRIRTATGLSLAWPLAGISSADLSAGKVVFLSDERPAAATWHPLVGLPSVASRAAKYGQPRFNQSASGGPLTLAYSSDSPSTGIRETKSFAKGVALRSRSELVYRLPRGYSRFLALAGIEPAAAASGNVMFSIFADDHLLIEQAIAGSDAPLPLDFDVAGVKRLKFVVDYGQNLDTGDWLNVCNARIVK